MLNDRQKIDLDNYITGHWGEDQFKNEPEPDDEPTDDDRTFDLPQDFELPQTDRLRDITQDTELAFWAAVVKHFPSVTTGDLDPDIVCNLRTYMQAAIERWIALNVTK